MLPPLPYEYSALEPFISARTLHFHHDKHHAKYVATTNDMIKGTDMEHDAIEEIIRKAHGECCCGVFRKMRALQPLTMRIRIDGLKRSQGQPGVVQQR